ncbi:MAG TPA: signal peptidase II [Gammaproteobacteria bacterium]|nr:signal peptidase II [Gammaproteobacteria bacterium]
MRRWVTLAVVVVLLDQWSKHEIGVYFALQERMVLTSFFNITLLHNAGAAFSMLNEAGGWQRWLFMALAVGVAVLILAWLRRLPRRLVLLPLGLTMVLGGAVGNLIDRSRLGYVVDFIQVHYQDWYFPAFNLADSAITLGVALLLIDAFRDPPDTARNTGFD